MRLLMRVPVSQSVAATSTVSFPFHPRPPSLLVSRRWIGTGDEMRVGLSLSGCVRKPLTALALSLSRTLRCRPPGHLNLDSYVEFHQIPPRVFLIAALVRGCSVLYLTCQPMRPPARVRAARTMARSSVVLGRRSGQLARLMYALLHKAPLRRIRPSSFRHHPVFHIHLLKSKYLPHLHGSILSSFHHPLSSIRLQVPRRVPPQRHLLRMRMSKWSPRNPTMPLRALPLMAKPRRRLRSRRSLLTRPLLRPPRRLQASCSALLSKT